MKRATHLLTLLLLVASPTAPFVAHDVQATAPSDRSFAVVAVVDTGLNAESFPDSSLVDEPAAYITGYPINVPPIGTNGAGAVQGTF